MVIVPQNAGLMVVSSTELCNTKCIDQLCACMIEPLEQALVLLAPNKFIAGATFSFHVEPVEWTLIAFGRDDTKGNKHASEQMHVP